MKENSLTLNGYVIKKSPREVKMDTKYFKQKLCRIGTASREMLKEDRQDNDEEEPAINRQDLEGFK